MYARRGWVEWARVGMLLGMLLCSACGRIGFQLLTADHAKPRKKGLQDAGSIDARANEAADAQAGDGGDSGMSSSPMDAAADAVPVVSDSGSMDAAVDATQRANDAGSGRDAGDSAVPPDASADAAPSCTTTAVADYCTELARLPVVPQIDGQLECDLQLHDITPVGWTNATSPIPAGHLARLAAAWRDDGVYVFLDVTDDTRLPAATGSNVWCGDGIEVYVDSDGTYAAAPVYDAPGTIQALASAPLDSTTAVSTGGVRYRAPNGGLVGPWSSPRYAAFPKPGGYVFEAFIQADDLDLTTWTLMTGGAVGLDIGINVSVSTDPPPSAETPDCGRRLGQYFLRIAPAPCASNCQPFANASAFCAPALRQ